MTKGKAGQQVVAAGGISLKISLELINRAVYKQKGLPRDSELLLLGGAEFKLSKLVGMLYQPKLEFSSGRSSLVYIMPLSFECSLYTGSIFWTCLVHISKCWSQLITISELICLQDHEGQYLNFKDEKTETQRQKDFV